ncbi:glycoside hydrolase family 97 protein [Persicobacter diffluens]
MKQDQWSVDAPDGGLTVNFKLDEGKVFYQIEAKSTEIMPWASLGAVRSDTDLSQQLSFVDWAPIATDHQKVALISGKQSQLDEKCQLAVLRLQNPQQEVIEIHTRVFNQGVAMKYHFPGTSEVVVKMLEDKMTFHFGEQDTAFMQVYDKISPWNPSYEKFYRKEEVNAKAMYNHGWCFPALFQTNGRWLLLSDAGVSRNFAGMHLTEAQDGVFGLRWPEEGEANGLYEQHPSSTLPWSTSWKTITVGQDLNEIIQSEMVKLVAAPNQVSDTEWIRPGKASWSWLSDHDSPQDYQSLVKFVDLAAEMNWAYSLVDANWNMMKGGDIHQLIEYANTKNVGLLLWYNSGGPHNEITEAPRNIMNNAEKRRAEFKKLQEWGIKGVKVDFFQSDKQEIMKLYQDILKDAADFEILVNFHGCAIPRGWQRTYPNLMTMESVFGAEAYSFSDEYTEYAATANTILPFTRNVVGPMDYTPVVFTHLEKPHTTTYGHELALSVVFESGLQHMGDAVEGYMALPKYAQQFLREVPNVWDETRLVEGYPGKEIILARRKGDRWFIGGLNGENVGKTFQLDLSFIDGAQEWNIITDGPDVASFMHSQTQEKNFEIQVLPKGGFVISSQKIAS